MADLPKHPVNGTEQYLAAIHGRLGELIDLLKPAPTPEPAPEPAPALVDLTEPAKAPTKKKRG